MSRQPSRVRKLSKMVLEQTGGGRALVEFLMSVYEGRLEGVSMRERLEAAKILLERGFGKAPIQIDVTGEVRHTAVSRVDVGKLTDDDLSQLRRMLRGATVAGALPPAVEQEVEDAEVLPDVGEDAEEVA